MIFYDDFMGVLDFKCPKAIQFLEYTIFINNTTNNILESPKTFGLHAEIFFPLIFDEIKERLTRFALCTRYESHCYAGHSDYVSSSL